jgi:hypothetical protein
MNNINFKYYDILSHLVPGLLIYAVINHYMKQLAPDLPVVPLLAIAYVIGYFNNTLSSWLEGFYRYLMGGNPINSFFDKQGIWKVRFSRGMELKQLLRDKMENQTANNYQVFIEAMKIANSNSTSRLEDLNASYAFSRGIVTSLLITGSLIIYFNYSNFFAYLAVLSLLLISLFRCHQRNGYYVREVLNVVLTSFNK